jgi:hypothetical protein
LENLYPPAHQLALDMLKRLSTANEEIIEVLLSKQQILPALRYLTVISIETSNPKMQFYKQTLFLQLFLAGI